MLQKTLRDAGVECQFTVQSGESLIQRARNRMVSEFMRSGYTHLFFIDADIQFNPADVLEMLKLSDKEVICGAYPRKHIQWDEVRKAALEGRSLHDAGSSLVFDPDVKAAQSVGDGVAKFAVDRGCIEIMHAATGFLIIQRKVLLEMMEEYFEDTMYYDDCPGESFGNIVFSLFDCAIVDGRYLSEDYYFSYRWRKMGGKIWLYLPAKLNHVGRHVFEANIANQMVLEAEKK
jgi:hypothetical protein